MIKIKDYILKIILSFVILFIFLINNTHRNIINILNNDHNKRINSVYGFCGNESIGYLRYLKKKYNFKKNPKIINYIHTPNVSWAIINPATINEKSDKIILLNYPGSNIDINFKKKKNNIYEIKNLSFYFDKIKEIKEIDIIFENNYNEKISIRTYTKNIKDGKQFSKTFKKFLKLSDSHFKFYLNMNIKEINSFDNLFLKIENLGDKNKIKKIKINADNKYNIKNLKFLDNIDNCYLLEKND